MAFNKPKSSLPLIISSASLKFSKENLKTTKNEFISSYANKFGMDSFRQKKYIGKIFDDFFSKNDAHLKKIRNRLYEGNSRSCKTEENSQISDLKNDDKKANLIILDENNEPSIKNHDKVLEVLSNK